MSSVIIVGATSTIAKAVAREFAEQGYDLLLTGRDRAELDRMADDLHTRFRVGTRVYLLDALDFESHEAVVGACLAEGGAALAGVVVCLGYLGDQAVAQSDFAEARRILDINLTACVSILTPIADAFEQRRSGFICVLSSVAGDRGRQSNYLYGAAKGGLSIYLQGLRNRLSRANVHVTTIKPGFVDTQMTYGKEGMFLVAPPEQVAQGVRRAIERRRDVVYLPGFWSPIMMVIRSIPETVFKRLRL